jgi:hypothetical protein
MQPSLLPLAVIAMAGWAALFCALLVRTRTKLGQQAAVSPRNWAEQSPAIVALLCANSGEVPDCAVTATFLDLIARGFLKRSARSGQVRIEVADADRSALKPYERQVLDHVEARTKVGGGAVLEQALRLESSEHAKRWMAKFSDDVIAEAREGGLIEQSVSLWACFWLSLTLLVGVVLLAAASIGTFLGVITFLVLAQSTKFLRGERPTETGSRLVPMYRALAADLSASARPNDRKAAYAAALGKTGERSPLAYQDGGEAWSNRSGQWRRVRIVDPPVWFHGADPVGALYALPSALVFFGIWTWLLYTATFHPERWSVYPVVLAAGWAILALGNFFVWGFVYRGIYDLCHGTVGIEGQVIYLYARESSDSETTALFCYVAIDDGRRSTAVKHEIDQALFDQLRYGDWLRLEVTPKLRRVKSTRVVSAPAPA